MARSPASFFFRPRLLELFTRPKSDWSLPTEILAGVSVGLVALPLALALGIASIPSGTPTPYPAPALGIITAILAGLLVSSLSGSRVQIAGPTAAFVPIVLLIVNQHGYGGLLVATMMAGVILVLMGLTRMGNLIKFIPWPVTSGFTTGIAVAIMLVQFPDFLGLHATAPAPREFWEKIPWLIQHLPNFDLRTTLIAILSLAAIFLWPKLGWKVVPASIVALLGSTVLVAVLGWESSGAVATVGSKFGPEAIPTTLPAPLFPEISWARLRDLVGPATAIALLGAIESLLSAVVADGLAGDRHDSNTELIAQGIANIVSPFFGGLPVTGAIARTSANITAGARTPIAGIVHALTLLAILLLASRWAVHIPMAALSAILIAVACRMGEWHEIRRLPRMPRSDALVLLTTCSLTVVFDLVIAIEVGMVLAAILFIKRISETTEVSRVSSEDVLERPEHLAQGKEIPEGVLVYRIFGPFLFGAAEKMEDALANLGELPRILILRLHLVTAMDATGMNALESVIERMQAHGGTVILSGIHQQPLQMLHKAGFLDQIGRDNLCPTFDHALARARFLLRSESAITP